MKRIQLYLDDDLWEMLQAEAHSKGTSTSHILRQAIRDWYRGKLDDRRSAMQAFIGIRGKHTGSSSSEEYVRRLRRGRRLES